MGLELYYLWGMRIAIVFIFLGILLPNKRRKTILSKAIRKRNSVYVSDTNKFIQFLDRATENSFLRSFMLKEDSDEYIKLENKIVQAGGIWGLTPNIVQLFRMIFPAMGFVFMLSFYLIRQATVSVSLTPSFMEQIVDEQDVLGGFLQSKVDVSTAAQASGFQVNWVVIMWIFIFSLLLYMLPNLIIDLLIKKRKELMRKELPIIETFIVIMLETGSYTVYDILRTLLDTTVFFKPYITMCLNEYYVDPNRAIQNMADRVQDEEFQVVCNSLKQAVDSDKRHTATFMKQHLDQIKKIQDLQKEAMIKKKPLLYVFLLALPLMSIVVIWFFPWFTKAMKMLSTGF
jgi:hypothetical protein